MSEQKEIQIGKFGNMQNDKDASDFITFLDMIENLPQAKTLRQFTYNMLNIVPGAAVIDVGCGAGRAVDELRGMNANAVGIDSNEKMIETAHRRFPVCDFRIASAEKLPFDNASIDCYRAERLYQHLANPSVVLTEAKRVLRSGGTIVLTDQDYDMWGIDSDDEPTTRAIVRALSNSITYRWIGRRYHALLVDAGFKDIRIEVQTLIYTDYKQIAPALVSFVETAKAVGAINQETANTWLAEQQQRGIEKRFFFALPMFVASARTS